MVRHFSTGELAGMQATQESAMMDICVIGTFVAGGVDDYGQPLPPTYSDSSPTPCGIRELTGMERFVPEYVFLEQDAVLRLPIDTVVDTRDRITITHRFGVVLASPKIYEVVGDPSRGPSGLQVGLKRKSV